MKGPKQRLLVAGVQPDVVACRRARAQADRVRDHEGNRFRLAVSFLSHEQERMPFITPDYIHDPLYVVCVVFNAARYKHGGSCTSGSRSTSRIGRDPRHRQGSFGERHHALDAGETQHDTPIHQAAPTKDAEFHKARSTNPHQRLISERLLSGA